MSQTIYYTVKFVTLHENNPGFKIGSNEGNPFLEIAGVSTGKHQYSYVVGFQNEPVPASDWDFPEFAIGFTTFVKPASFEEQGKYRVESRDGAGRDAYYSVWGSLTVPDDYLTDAGSAFANGTALGIAQFKDSAKAVLNYLTVVGHPLGGVGSTMFKSVNLYNALSSHGLKQFDLMKQVEAGQISLEEYSLKTDQAMIGMGIGAAASAAGLSSVAGFALKTMVTQYVVTKNPAHAYFANSVGSTSNAGAWPSDVQSFRVFGGVGDEKIYDQFTSGDFVAAGPGNDTVMGNLGSDFLVGGDGVDTLDYRSVDVKMDIDLRDGFIWGNKNTDSPFVDRVAGFENVVGSYTDDTIVGSKAANFVEGLSGSDNLLGLEGNDTFIGGAGGDTFQGGGGRDAVRYYELTQNPTGWWGGLVVSLQNPGLGETSPNTGEAAGDWFFDVEDLALTSGNDTGIGTDAGNRIWGEGGKDSLRGRGGADTIAGGVGNDRIWGDAGADRLIGGVGRDTLAGGSDADTFAFAKGDSGLRTSNVDTITDWNPADGIDTNITGTSTNYREIKAASSIDSIEEAVAYADANAGPSVRHVFLFNTTTDTAYLLMDLDSNGAFETGVILNKAGTAAEFSYSDLI